MALNSILIQLDARHTGRISAGNWDRQLRLAAGSLAETILQRLERRRPFGRADAGEVNEGLQGRVAVPVVELHAQRAATLGGGVGRVGGIQVSGLLDGKD